MDQPTSSSQALAFAITHAASKQSYTTIRLLADRDRVADACRAYAYFRWVDDVLDAPCGTPVQKAEFIARQEELLAACYRTEQPAGLATQEHMLCDLVRRDPSTTSGVYLYLHHMMEVMAFDARRRGRVISQAELDGYSHHLAVAVTEALYYFIGHDDPSPRHPSRYLAVTAAHITHMLRDTLEDTANGYYNIPGEVLAARGITPQDVGSPAYREWICERVQLARRYFRAARACTAQVKNLRCRLAGYAYTARFEWMLGIIERDRYCLRSEYPERKSLRASLWMGWSTLASVFAPPLNTLDHHHA